MNPRPEFGLGADWTPVTHPLLRHRENYWDDAITNRGRARDRGGACAKANDHDDADAADAAVDAVAMVAAAALVDGACVQLGRAC